MSNPKIVTSSISIHAPAAKVWNALVNPEETKKYMFGCEALSDWKVGSSLIWKGVFNDIELIAVKGEILEIRPGSYLAYTVIDPNNTAIPDIPENYLTVTYELEETNGMTTVTATMGDYNKVAEGEKRYKESMDGGGWDVILEAIKKQVEE